MAGSQLELRHKQTGPGGKKPPTMLKKFELFLNEMTDFFLLFDYFHTK